MTAGRPARPLEQKVALGNPGKRALPKPMEFAQGGYIEPFRPLEFAGTQLWESAMKTGGNWIARNSDTHLLLMTCEQLDRREELRALAIETHEWRIYKQLLELERTVSGNLSLLGFTPSDRTKLGLAEVKTRSKLDELIERKNNRT
jgi:hypothetical protein